MTPPRSSPLACSLAATLLQRLDVDDARLMIPLHADSTIAPERTRPDERGREALAALLGALWTAGPLAAWVLEHRGVHVRTLDDAVTTAGDHREGAIPRGWRL